MVIVCSRRRPREAASGHQWPICDEHRRLSPPHDRRELLGRQLIADLGQGNSDLYLRRDSAGSSQLAVGRWVRGLAAAGAFLRSPKKCARRARGVQVEWRVGASQERRRQAGSPGSTTRRAAAGSGLRNLCCSCPLVFWSSDGKNEQNKAPKPIRVAVCRLPPISGIPWGGLLPSVAAFVVSGRF